MWRWLSLFFCFAFSLECYVERGPSLQSVYTSLDPTSVAQHFAFYELYPDTPLGKTALRHAWELLQGEDSKERVLPPIQMQPLISFVNRLPGSTKAPILEEKHLDMIHKLSRHLKNRTLKGFGIWSAKELHALDPNEVDLARGLFLAEMENDTPEERKKVRSYEAHIDLMALQILAKLSPSSGPYEQIRAINDYIFSEMRFRFPPHSLYVKDIDIYTLLPSVLDSRRGVCLGVSILYLCLAQRIGLHLEAITPPGHIFVRYLDPNTSKIVNIETTARGIDVPTETYLGIETPKLQKRTIKDVIGLAFMNQASVSWHRSDTKTAISLYEKALHFLPNDYLVQLFLGFNYLFAGREKEGKELLQKIQNNLPDHMITPDSVSEDFLANRVDAKAIQVIFEEVDETRASILEKQKHLKKVVKSYPQFGQGVLHLAITYLQLGREKEALPLLERYISLKPNDPTGNYYLSALYFQRMNYTRSWDYLKRAEAIVAVKGHEPKALIELRQSLLRTCPEKRS